MRTNDIKELKTNIYSYYHDYKGIDCDDIENIDYNLENNIEKELDYCRIEYDFIRLNNIDDEIRAQRLDDIWEQLNYLKGQLQYKKNINKVSKNKNIKESE